MLSRIKHRVIDTLMHWNYRKQQIVAQGDLREILKTKPIRSREDASVDVFLLTAGEDLFALLIAVKSLQFWSELPLCFHICCDDGLLTDQHRAVISEHVQGARFITDRTEIRSRLKNYPAIDRFHIDSKDPSYPKLSIPALYAERPKVILMDTDVIFYRFPDLLTAWASNPDDQRDLYRHPVKVNDPYPFPALEEELQAKYGIGPRPMLESGLLLFHRDLLNLDHLEAVSDAFNRHGFHRWSKELEIYNVLYRIRGKAEPLPRKDYGGVWTYGAAGIHYFSKDMFRPSSLMHIASLIQFLQLADLEGFKASDGLDR